MLAGPHPKYGRLSYGRWMKIRGLTEGRDTVTQNQVAWFVCTHHFKDPELLRVLESANPVDLILDYCEENLPAPEMDEFLPWINERLTATDAATTKPKEDTGPGKPEDSEPAEVNHTS